MTVNQLLLVESVRARSQMKGGVEAVDAARGKLLIETPGRASGQWRKASVAQAVDLSV